MVVRQVEYYLAVCRERNFTRAAKSCGVSQPSLTNGIKTLERECGGKLFSRSFCSPAELTALGERLRPYFESIADNARKIREEAEKPLRNQSCSPQDDREISPQAPQSSPLRDAKALAKSAQTSVSCYGRSGTRFA